MKQWKKHWRRRKPPPKGENMNKVPKCCLCGVSCDEVARNKDWVQGNNPWPLSTKPDDRACDMCNDFFVVPKRFEEMFKRKEKV
jgi:hypothetical protein